MKNVGRNGSWWYCSWTPDGFRWINMIIKAIYFISQDSSLCWNVSCFFSFHSILEGILLNIGSFAGLFQQERYEWLQILRRLHQGVHVGAAGAHLCPLQVISGGFFWKVNLSKVTALHAMSRNIFEVIWKFQKFWNFWVILEWFLTVSKHSTVNFYVPDELLSDLNS